MRLPPATPSAYQYDGSMFAYGVKDSVLLEQLWAFPVDEKKFSEISKLPDLHRLNEHYGIWVYNAKTNYEKIVSMVPIISTELGLSAQVELQAGSLFIVEPHKSCNHLEIPFVQRNSLTAHLIIAVSLALIADGLLTKADAFNV